MKKITCLIAALFICSISFAQFGVNLGYTTKIIDSKYRTSEKRLKDLAEELNDDFDDFFLNGIVVGVYYNWEFAKNFSLRPGINYELTFYAETDDFESIANSFVRITTKLMDHTLSIPIRVQYGIKLGEKLKLNIFAGPSFNVGIGMSSEFTYTNLFVEENSTTSIYNLYSNQGASNRARYKRFNLQMGGGVGLAFGKFELNLTTDWGLLNISNISNFMESGYGGFIKFGEQMHNPLSVKFAYNF